MQKQIPIKDHRTGEDVPLVHNGQTGSDLPGVKKTPAPEQMTLKEVAKHLDVSERTISLWILDETKNFPKRTKHTRKYKLSEIDKWREE